MLRAPHFSVNHGLGQFEVVLLERVYDDDVGGIDDFLDEPVVDAIALDQPGP